MPQEALKRIQGFRPEKLPDWNGMFSASGLAELSTARCGPKRVSSLQSLPRTAQGLRKRVLACRRDGRQLP